MDFGDFFLPLSDHAKELLLRAEKGDCSAMNLLYFKFSFGIGEKRNQEEAKRWSASLYVFFCYFKSSKKVFGE